MFKSNILSSVEYRTPAFLHAASTHLDAIDRIGKRFLEQIGVTAYDALLRFIFGFKGLSAY